MTKALEHLLCEERLTDLRLLSLEKERLRGSYQCIKIPAEDGGRLFSVVASDKTRVNKHKLKYSKSHLSLRKKCFYSEDVNHRRKLTSEVVTCPYVEVWKRYFMDLFDILNSSSNQFNVWLKRSIVS